MDMIYAFFTLVFDRPLSRQKFIPRLLVLCVVFGLLQYFGNAAMPWSYMEIPLLLYLSYIVIRRGKDVGLSNGGILVTLVLLYIPYLSFLDLIYLASAKPYERLLKHPKSTRKVRSTHS